MMLGRCYLVWLRLIPKNTIIQTAPRILIDLAQYDPEVEDKC